VGIDKRYHRAEELRFLKGDCSKIKTDLGWVHEYTFETMIDEMIEYWLEYYEK
jgi:GDP-D-mannose dehydratase